jgi:hypothetical protein
MNSFCISSLFNTFESIKKKKKIRYTAISCREHFILDEIMNLVMC